MKVTILGASGFLGRRLAARLARSGRMGGDEVSELTLFDVVMPPALPVASADLPFKVRRVQGDIADPTEALAKDTRIIFHLAAIVSAQAEADPALGLTVTLHGSLAVAEACRRLVEAGGRAPRFVFASSVATFSGGQDAEIAADGRQMPANSHGAQKAAAELLLGDASRRGHLDLVSLRLPTVIIRPGPPNRAASSFLSSILREPLAGKRAVLPVGEDFAALVASPARVVEWLMHAAMLDTRQMGLDRGVNPPGLSVTVARMLEALEAAKPGATALISRVPDPAITAILGAWPTRFEPYRARTLGFSSHERLADVVASFIAEQAATQNTQH